MAKKPKISMKDLAAQHHFRLVLDESYQAGEDKAWYWQFPGKYGHVWVYGSNQLAAYTHSNQIGHRLEEVPGAKVIQRGDREMSLTFPIDQLSTVAGLLHLKHKRVLSEEQRARLRELAEKGRANSPIGHKPHEGVEEGDLDFVD